MSDASPEFCARGCMCTWSHHGYKHFAAAGATREDTKRPNPAKYLPTATRSAVAAVERETVCRPRCADPGAAPTRGRYLRETREIIGWDDGEDATLSFVECAQACFHGRPMRAENPLAHALASRTPSAGGGS